MLYALSDLHFFHKNILNFEPGRNHFANVDEMNEEIVTNWNNTVTNEDTIILDGDVGIGNPTKIAHMLARLNGNISLYPGNHDSTKILKAIEEHCPRVTIMPYMTRMKFHGVQAFISHFPVDVGRRATLFSIHGHIHSNQSGNDNQVNICTDNPYWGLKLGEPIPFERIQAHILEIRDRLEIELYSERTDRSS